MLKLSSPWATYYKELKEMFGRDPEIKIMYDEEEIKVRFYVDNFAKAEAISNLLPDEKTFGNVTLKIAVIPSNKELPAVEGTIFDKAFDGNPAYCYSVPIEGVFDNNLTYVVFAREVVQFFNDDMSDLNGLCTTLYEDIARDLFDVPGMYYCTDAGIDDKNWI